MDRSPIEAEEDEEDYPDGPAQGGTAGSRAPVWEDARISRCPVCKSCARDGARRGAPPEEGPHPQGAT
eukprot:11214398-Lingulodinium_polyedra.AAC.1